jgi:hypothetical protein
MLPSYKRSQMSIILRVKILDSAATTGAGKTGLAYNTSGLIVSTIADNEATATVYTQAASHIETISTLGTYAAPSADCCRFKEVDSTNHKGVYEVQLADARFAVAGAKSLLVSISGASGAAETDCVIPLVDLDPYNATPTAASVTGNVGGNLLGTIGGLAAQAKADVNAEADMALSDAGVTSSRAAKLDYVPAGMMPTQAEVLAIQNTTRSKAVVPGTIERPDSGSTAYKLSLYLYDEAGNMEAPDALPTVSAANQAGTDRSANLGSVTLLSTGAYEVTYSLAYDAAVEQLLFVWTYLEGGNTLKVPCTTQVVDTTAVDFTAADRTKLETVYDDWIDSGRLDLLIDAIKSKTDGLPASPAAMGDAMTLTAAYDAAKTAAQAGNAMTLTSAQVLAIADALLGRNVSNVEATAPEHSLATIVLAILQSAMAGTTWTIYRTDGTTPHAAKAVTTDAAASPITEVS